jgi:hypothetical protein
MMPRGVETIVGEADTQLLEEVGIQQVRSLNDPVSDCILADQELLADQEGHTYY